MQKFVNLVDLVKSFLTSIYYLLVKFVFDKAENEPLNFCQEFAIKLEQSQSKQRFFVFILGSPPGAARPRPHGMKKKECS